MNPPRKTSYFIIWAIFALTHGSHADQVIGTVEDFSGIPTGPVGKGFVDDWRWSDVERKTNQLLSEIGIEEVESDRRLKVTIDPSLPFPREAHRVFSFPPHFPPQADGIRLRIKVESGVARIFLGGPTAYYGNSDVFTEVKTVKAEKPPLWREIEFSLNHPLWRNFRRAGFSTEAPRIYYNRWAQEPTSLYVAQGSEGTMWIDQVELTSKGEGKPFPVFSSAEINPVQTIADFEDGELDEAFTIYMADSESEWFEESWKRERPLRFSPTVFSITDTGGEGKKSLLCVGTSAEEVHSGGIFSKGSSEANALQFVIRNQAPDRRNLCVGMGPVEPFDILVFTCPSGKPFPWKRFGASEEMKATGNRGFDFQLSYREIRNLDDVDFAIYQARRFLKSGEWTPLTIPLADFTCIYGTGTETNRFQEQEPVSGNEICAITWMHPWSRMGDRNAPVTTEIDSIKYVRVPEDNPSRLISYWQIPDLENLRPVRAGNGATAKLKILLPNESIDFP